MNLVQTSYNKEDVTILLKDLTSVMKEENTEEREKAIQSGKHYSSMLPKESEPSPEYEKLFVDSLNKNKWKLANYVATVAKMVMRDYVKDDDSDDAWSSGQAGYKEEYKPILVSLARAGIPIGILIKRYIKQKYNIDCPHYAISIIRDKGIDENAMEYIYKTEVVNKGNCVSNIFFIDGWTGKGVIQAQVFDAVRKLMRKDDKWSELNYELYVLADPANITQYCATHDDLMIPSSCLNSTVSGLISRTILNEYTDVKNGDFHGAVYFERFKDIDYSNKLINDISNEFQYIDNSKVNSDYNELCGRDGYSVVEDISNKFKIKDIKKIKPGIGETTRVLLRRLPWKILVNISEDMDSEELRHIKVLCEEKGVNIERFNIGQYKVCGIIKELADA